MDNHGHLKNPKELIQEAKNRRRHDNRLLYYNDIALEWMTNHLLASVIFFDVALIVPLLTLNDRFGLQIPGQHGAIQDGVGLALGGSWAAVAEGRLVRLGSPQSSEAIAHVALDRRTMKKFGIYPKQHI